MRETLAPLAASGPLLTMLSVKEGVSPSLMAESWFCLRLTMRLLRLPLPHEPTAGRAAAKTRTGSSRAATRRSVALRPGSAS